MLTLMLQPADMRAASMLTFCLCGRDCSHSLQTDTVAISVMKQNEALCLFMLTSNRRSKFQTVKLKKRGADLSMIPHVSICRLSYAPSCFCCTWIRSTSWSPTVSRRMQPWNTLKGFLHPCASSSLGQPEEDETDCHQDSLIGII